MESLSGLTYEAIDGLRAIARANSGRAIMNAFTQPAAPDVATLPAGIQFFDFDTVGKQVFIPITPLANSLPRTTAGGTAMFWREIYQINSEKHIPGVSEGKRGAVIDRKTRDRVSKFAGLGYENVATFESQYAARGVADPKSLAKLDGLKALRMAEERVLLGGNVTKALGTPAKPTGSKVAGTTACTARAAVTCIVVALTQEGGYLSSVADGVATTVTRTNADGTTDTIKAGSSLKSAASDPVAVAAGDEVTWKVADVHLAAYYAWFTGAAGAQKLAAVTSINVFVQTADEDAAAQAAAAIIADNSQNALEFDGIWAVASNPDNLGYYHSNENTPLTADGAGNISEFVAAFYWMYTNFYFGPTELLMHPLEAYSVTKILLGGPAAAIYAKYIQQSDAIVGGFYVTKVLNPFTGELVNITVHPYMPQGHIIVKTDGVPYPIEDLARIWEVVQRQPYYSIDWPLASRKNEVGMYVDEGLKCGLPFAQGVIKNVKSTL